MSLSNLHISLLVYFAYFAFCIPVNVLPVSDATRLSQNPDLSPLIYHIPNTHNTLYILPYNFALPPDGLESSIRGAIIYIAHQIVAKGKADLPLPPDQDPFVYGLDLPVEISWQSAREMKLTWRVLAAAMRGLNDCLVKNNHLPFMAIWRVYDRGQQGEVGWGLIGRGKGRAVS